LPAWDWDEDPRGPDSPRREEGTDSRPTAGSPGGSDTEDPDVSDELARLVGVQVDLRPELGPAHEEQGPADSAGTDEPHDDAEPTPPPPSPPTGDTSEAKSAAWRPAKLAPASWSQPLTTAPAAATSGPQPDRDTPAPTRPRPTAPPSGFFEEPDDLDDLEASYDEDEDDSRRRLRALLIIGAVLILGLLIGLLVSRMGSPQPAVELEEGPGVGAQPDAGGDVDPDEPAEDPEVPEGLMAPDEDAEPTEPDEVAEEPEATAPPSADGTTVQVLDGARDIEGYEAAIAYLTELGYTVTASGPSGPRYAETTIFYTEDNEPLAEELIGFDPRFGVVAPNDRGLSSSIDLHVVIGEDWVDDDEPDGAADA
jgi:hypothetical protein